jgi:hypothetical protein
MAEEYFLTEFDVYRLGNSTSPRLDHVRVPKDIPTFFVGPIEHVQAGMFGISLMDKAGLERRIEQAKRAGSTVGHVWRIARGVALPMGLAMREDPKDRTHLLLGPSTAMPIEKFRGLLLELAARCTYVGKR